MGLFGLAFVEVDAPGEASTAVFAVVLEALPAWAGLVLILLGLVLVMSSADTILNAVASLIAVDLQHVRPAADGARRMRVARLAILALAVPVVAVAAQGFSVLYLFLLADLLCAAAAFPVFYGLYNPHYSERAAAWSLLAGLAAGAALFPAPDMSGGSLLGAFVLAATVPAAVSLAWPRRAEPFDFAGLRTAVRPIAE
jgi:Na+/proline symporter